jgi:hypothetical protein
MMRKIKDALISLTEFVWPNEYRPLHYQARRWFTDGSNYALDIVQRLQYERLMIQRANVMPA